VRGAVVEVHLFNIYSLIIIHLSILMLGITDNYLFFKGSYFHLNKKVVIYFEFNMLPPQKSRIKIHSHFFSRAFY